MLEAASSGADPLFAQPARNLEKIGVEADVLVDREVLIEPEALGHVAEMPLCALGLARRHR